MGSIASRPEESALFLRDQNRCTSCCPPAPLPASLPPLTSGAAVSVAALSITNSRGRTLLHITPNAFPATRYTPRRELGDDSVIDYVLVSCRRPHAQLLLALTLPTRTPSRPSQARRRPSSCASPMTTT